jgi:hypothetical protein
MIEYSTFINNSWVLGRHLTYLAVTKSAVDELIKYTGSQEIHGGTQSLFRKAHINSSRVLEESILCLRSSSPS